MSIGTDLRIDGYEIVGTLDEGRSPTYRAIDQAAGEEVVIKLLDRSKDPIVPKRLDLRWRKIPKLVKADPGFVRCLANGETADLIDYIIVPYFRHGSAQDLIDTGPIPWRRAARIISSASRVVAGAHFESVALGDLRPSALLMQDAETPSISVYGMASVRFDDGTPTYRAPEQTERAKATPRGDVYSLSKILVALVLGRPRERKEKIEEYLAAAAAAEPELPMLVLAKGLATDPDQRYAHAGLLRSAIDYAIDPALGPPPPSEHDKIDPDAIARAAALGAETGRLPSIDDIVFAESGAEPTVRDASPTTSREVTDDYALSSDLDNLFIGLGLDDDGGPGDPATVESETTDDGPTAEISSFEGPTSEIPLPETDDVEPDPQPPSAPPMPTPPQEVEPAQTFDPMSATVTSEFNPSDLIDLATLTTELQTADNLTANPDRNREAAADDESGGPDHLRP